MSVSSTRCCLKNETASLDFSTRFGYSLEKNTSLAWLLSKLTIGGNEVEAESELEQVHDLDFLRTRWYWHRKYLSMCLNLLLVLIDINRVTYISPCFGADFDCRFEYTPTLRIIDSSGRLSTLACRIPFWQLSLCPFSPWPSPTYLKMLLLKAFTEEQSWFSRVRWYSSSCVWLQFSCVLGIKSDGLFNYQVGLTGNRQDAAHCLKATSQSSRTLHPGSCPLRHRTSLSYYHTKWNPLQVCSRVQGASIQLTCLAHVYFRARSSFW